MRVSMARPAIVAVAAVLAAGCSGDDGSTASPTTAAQTTVVPPASCVVAEAASELCWEEVLPLGNGAFPTGSGNTPEWEPGKFPLTLTPQVAFDGDLWMTAQVVAYSSPDGLVWTEHQKTDTRERIYSSVVFFDDRLWMFGGFDYDTRTFLNDVWVSSDGVTWTNEGPAAWSPRGGHAIVAYRDRLWLLGGADRVADDLSLDRFLNDVWISDDGLVWREATAGAPWPARDYPGAVVFDDALHVVGGQNQADVWRSEDGEAWTLLTDHPGWEVRGGGARAVFDGKLWVFGGWAGETTNALNDVWISSDGVTWEQQAEHAPWAPRAPITVVFDERIWIYSGKHTGAEDNWGGDLWQLRATAPDEGD
jgi:hypothetical protein